MAAETGSVDISFNLISHGDVQGTPLVEMTPDDFAAYLQHQRRHDRFNNQFCQEPSAPMAGPASPPSAVQWLVAHAARGPSPLRHHPGSGPSVSDCRCRRAHNSEAKGWVLRIQLAGRRRADCRTGRQPVVYGGDSPLTHSACTQAHPHAALRTQRAGGHRPDRLSGLKV